MHAAGERMKTVGVFCFAAFLSAAIVAGISGLMLIWSSSEETTARVVRTFFSSSLLTILFGVSMIAVRLMTGVLRTDEES